MKKEKQEIILFFKIVYSVSRNYNCISNALTAKRNRATKRFVSFALVNARSLSKRTNVISHYIVSNNLNLLAVTEIWLTTTSGDNDLLDLCPTGFSAVHLARSNKRGGGVALFYRDSFSVEVVPAGLTLPSFEHLVVMLRFNSVCVRLVIVYRPPSQSTKCSEGTFLSEFSDFLRPLALSSGKLLVVGDFNIHIEKATNSTTTQFLSLLDSNGFSQHVKGMTHIDGHRLDLIISRESDNLISSSFVSDLIADHFAVRSFIKVHRPSRPLKKVTYRELNGIDADSFLSDMLSLPLFTSPASDVSDLLAQYNDGLSSVLDIHAPVQTKFIAV